VRISTKCCDTSKFSCCLPNVQVKGSLHEEPLMLGLEREWLSAWWVTRIIRIVAETLSGFSGSATST
jgi:hypothetical protein